MVEEKVIYHRGAGGPVKIAGQEAGPGSDFMQQ